MTTYLEVYESLVFLKLRKSLADSLHASKISLKIRTGDMMKWGECGAGSFMVYDLAGNYILGFLFHHCLGQIYGRKMLHLKAT